MPNFPVAQASKKGEFLQTKSRYSRAVMGNGNRAATAAITARPVLSCAVHGEALRGSHCAASAMPCGNGIAVLFGAKRFECLLKLSGPQAESFARALDRGLIFSSSAELNNDPAQGPGWHIAHKPPYPMHVDLVVDLIIERAGPAGLRISAVTLGQNRVTWCLSVLGALKLLCDVRQAVGASRAAQLFPPCKTLCTR